MNILNNRYKSEKLKSNYLNKSKLRMKNLKTKKFYGGFIKSNSGDEEYNEDFQPINSGKRPNRKLSKKKSLNHNVEDLERPNRKFSKRNL